MNINTGKLASSSSSFLKEIKDLDSNKKVSKLNKENILKNEKILSDFTVTNPTDKTLHSRIKNTNDKLTKYESELSKLQFIEQQIKEIDTKKSEPEQIAKIIENSVYKNEKILKNYLDIKSNTNIEEQIQEANKLIQEKYNALEKEFKSIEVASQNLISLYSNSSKIVGNNSNNIKSLQIEELTKSTMINSRRVIDLIS